MLELTDSAGAQLAKLLEQHGTPDDQAIRFVYDGHSIELEIDCRQHGDSAFEFGGRMVLLLDSEVTQILSEDTLDVTDGRLSLEHRSQRGQP